MFRPGPLARRRSSTLLGPPALALVACGCVANPFYAAPEIDASASEGGVESDGSTTSAWETSTSADATSTTAAATTSAPSTTAPATTETSGVMPSCGDGMIDADETCDDGMANGPGAACNEFCQPNDCGDGDKGPGEACDDGMANGPGALCNALCQLNVCGDGDKSPVEACDDGNDVDADGCELDCTVTMPDDIPGLVLWLRADAGVNVVNNQVAKWSDQSGKGNDALNGVEQPGPIYPSKSGQLNGIDVIRFDGPHPNGMRMGLPEVSGETVFAVAQSFDYTDNDSLLGQKIDFIYGTEILSEGNPYKPLGSMSMKVNNQPLAPIPVMTWHIVDATWPQGKAFTANRIGGVATDGSRSYSGDLAEMLIYDHPLSDAERNLVGWYLTQKYGLQTSYVAP